MKRLPEGSVPPRRIPGEVSGQASSHRAGRYTGALLADDRTWTVRA